MEMNLPICKYTNMKNQRIHRMILFIAELFDNQNVMNLIA